jgi:CDP-diacylglycerol---serine O-phosphatidyltransferase
VKQAEAEVVPNVGKKRTGMRASVYLLPNLITASSLFLGLLAMKLSFEGRILENFSNHFVLAAYCIIGAAIADGLDGSVARLTRTQSQFGVQLDSLCDLVSFGVAPGILIYNMALHQMNRVGFAVCFLYALCGALRLARFNVMASKGKASGNFTGIPIPMAAIPVCVCILAYHEMLLWTSEGGHAGWALTMADVLTRPVVSNWIFVGILFVLSLGMISTFEYVSTKNMRLPRKRPFRFLAFVLMCLVMLFTLEFTLTLAVLMLIYCLHGPVMWLFFKIDKAKEEEEIFSSGEEDEEEVNT